jgi:general stress protein YciG
VTKPKSKDKDKAEKAEKKKRGFAVMDPQRVREIAQRGGREAHRQGRAYEFTTQTASDAGRKGGAKVSADSDHMAEIGRKGGLARARNMQLEEEEAADGE